MPCLTMQFDQLRPIIEIIVKPSTILIEGGLEEKEMVVRALLDTGATHSCIDQTVAIALGLPSRGAQETQGVHGKGSVQQYDVNLIFPFGEFTFTLSNVFVTDCNIKPQGIDMLIGMDIISRGGFCINQGHGFTFCL